MNPPKNGTSLPRLTRSIDDDDEGSTMFKVAGALFAYGIFVGIFVLICHIRRAFESINIQQYTNRGNAIRNSYVQVQTEITPSSILAVQENTLGIESTNKEPTQPINERAEKLPYNPAFEIQPNNLDTFNRKLGKGKFGIINKGLLTLRICKTNEVVQVNVAVKKMVDPTDEKQDKLIYDEIKLMCAIGKHPNVLAIVGAITKKEKVSGREYNQAVSEFIEGGDLRSVLRNSPYTFQDEITSRERTGGQNVDAEVFDTISTSDLFSFAYQIANGMEYLASLPCVHRDLALRNVFVKKNKIIRIGDFGLARHNGDKDYYKVKYSPETPLPIFWLAPECFDDGTSFTEMTDVWSYGVCLFELFSLGASPYLEEFQNFFDPIYYVVAFLESGKRLSSPKYCRSDIYNFMLECWNSDAKQRPRFTKCKEFFKNLIKRKNFKNLETDLQTEEQLQCELSVG
ncbi:Protein kinase domain-containing protein [Caenorhabditis elegans]|uniref:Protein kinase domain-containing protein n=2 Tax=Caenorhabditis elegans TaxID=6239 RepID=Q21867_CAEEL|nr:Protein kinase domain-containing protein [Caenorhabditis elegans]CAA93871.4 Protein kinase domain-containing protein [Caenorhabditis elegans]|eukprot:NP_496025.2 Uncharacterized protein CELE_R09D1.12 [Caenorhabditis elegans]